MSKYAVVIENADPYLGPSVYQFDEYDRASTFLKWVWNDRYNDMIWRHIPLNNRECWCEEDRAKITWEDGRCLNFTVADICKTPEVFNVYYKRLMTGYPDQE